MLSSVQSAATSASAPYEAPAGPSGGSPEARLLALIVQNQLVQSESAKTSVSLSQEELQRIREEVRQALEAAREANEDSGFWGALGDVLGGDIATLAEVVVVAAASVATGGAAALVVAAVAIACTVASKYADELGIPPNVAIGIGIAAALASVASGNIAAGGSVATLAGASNGAVAVGAEAAQVSQLTQIAEQVKLYAKLAVPVATGAGAGAHMVEGLYAREAADHDAHARAAQTREKLEAMDIDPAVELLGRAVDRQLAALGEMSQSLEANQRSTQLIVGSFQGAA